MNRLPIGSQDAPDSGSPAPALNPSAAGACVGGFLLIGLFGGAYGPLLPYLQNQFHISSAAAGGLLSANSLGVLIGMLVTGVIDGRTSNRAQLTACLAAVAVGSVAFAWAPGWPALIAGAFAIGWGCGGLDVGINQLFSRGFGPRSTALTNLLHAMFGVGAVLAPFAVAALDRRTLFAILAALALVLVPAVTRVQGGGKRSTYVASTQATMWSLRFLAFAAAYLFYLALESGIGAWEPSQLRHAGFSRTVVTISASAYWVGVAAGRVAIFRVALRVPARTITLAAPAVAVATLCLATIPAVAPYAYGCAGLAISPIYPSGLVWAAANDTSTRKFTAWLQVASAVGATIFPAIIGALVELAGYELVPFLMTTLAVLTLAAFGTARRLDRPEIRTRSRAPVSDAPH